MGWGDELMAAGQARRMHLEDPKRRRVVIADQYGAARWHVLWEDSPYIARPTAISAGGFLRVVNGPGARPYHLEKRLDRWIFNPAFRADPAEIHFTVAERAFASSQAPQIVLEPTIKAKAPINKQWPIAHWREFVRLGLREGLRFSQLAIAGTQPLAGVELIVTPDFRKACAVLANARAYVGHEGGLHHAAAAVRIPGVVIFGGFTPVELTGYAIHRNLGVGIAGACGMRQACAHCAREMARIEPGQVLAELLQVLA